MSDTRQAPDDDFARAVRLVTNARFGAQSFIARRLGLPFSTVAELMDRMQEWGILSERVGTIAPEVLVTLGEAEKMLANGGPLPREETNTDPHDTPAGAGTADTAQSLSARLVAAADAAVFEVSERFLSNLITNTRVVGKTEDFARAALAVGLRKLAEENKGVHLGFAMAEDYFRRLADEIEESHDAR
ncbi:DNA translocase FtsK [Amycolatopsis sp. NPDC006131]|uniref:DNA translocase FtsK n=1 Tax=Amycolatopsis sp. NPDC006131 TaxID=3156731 RepID=UPI0033BB85AF